LDAASSKEGTTEEAEVASPSAAVPSSEAAAATAERPPAEEEADLGVQPRPEAEDEAGADGPRPAGELPLVTLVGEYFPASGRRLDLRQAPHSFDGRLDGALSISFVARWDALQSWSRIVDFGNGAAADNITISNFEKGKTLVADVYRGTSRKRLLMPGAIALGETRRYLFSVSSTGCMKMMCDARVLGELSGGYAPRETPRSQLLVGSSSWPADGFFHGHIADLKIWGSVVTWDVAFQEPRETWTDLPAPSSMQPSEELASKPTVLEEEVPPPLEQPAEKCAEVRSSELAESDVPETTSPPASRCRGNSGASGGSGGSGRCYPSHQPVQQVVDADATVEFRDEAVVNEAVINELPVREIDDNPPPGTPEEWAESPVYPGLMVPSQPLQMWQQHSAPSLQHNFEAFDGSVIDPLGRMPGHLPPGPLATGPMPMAGSAPVFQPQGMCACAAPLSTSPGALPVMFGGASQQLPPQRPLGRTPLRAPRRNKEHFTPSSMTGAQQWQPAFSSGGMPQDSSMMGVPGGWSEPGQFQPIQDGQFPGQAFGNPDEMQFGLGVDLQSGLQQEAQAKDKWEACWEWMNKGWCPRGDSCRWEHPAFPNHEQQGQNLSYWPPEQMPSQSGWSDYPEALVDPSMQMSMHR